MKQDTRYLVTMAALVGLALAGPAARAAEREGLSLVLHVTDFANTDPEQLHRARSEANRIFSYISVRVIWTDIAAGPRARACEGANLFVSLLSDFLVDERSKHGVADGALGSASPQAGHAFIYSERVRRLAARRGVDDGVLLGRVIAHEVGHLLMPGASHSQAGLMTAGIDTDPRGMQAWFLKAQSQSIRAVLKLKMEAQTAEPGCGHTTTAEKH